MNNHALETYKSLIQFGVAGLRTVMWLNGGAAIALLAFLGDLSSNPGTATVIPDVQWSMGCFVAGLFLVGMAHLTAYVTQLKLYNEDMDRSDPRWLPPHGVLLAVTVALTVLALGAFAWGALSAVGTFSDISAAPKSSG